MKVSKLDAGTAQLKEGIRLFFEERDPITVHTVAGAASLLLFNLGDNCGVESFVRGNPYVKEDKKGLWISKINEAQNFFKHADRDPKEEFDFEPMVTEILLFEGCLLVEGLTGKMFPEAKVFSIWFSAKYPDVVLEGSFKELVESFVSLGLDLNDFQSIRLFLETI